MKKRIKKMPKGKLPEKRRQDSLKDELRTHCDEYGSHKPGEGYSSKDPECLRCPAAYKCLQEKGRKINKRIEAIREPNEVFFFEAHLEPSTIVSISRKMVASIKKASSEGREVPADRIKKVLGQALLNEGKIKSPFLQSVLMASVMKDEHIHYNKKRDTLRYE